MAENDDEICEYVFGRKALMKRLLAMLRTGSSSSNNQPGSTENFETTGLLVLGVLGLFLMFYMLMFNRHRSSTEPTLKKGSLPNGPDDDDNKKDDDSDLGPSRPPNADFNVE